MSASIQYRYTIVSTVHSFSLARIQFVVVWGLSTQPDDRHICLWFTCLFNVDKCDHTSICINTYPFYIYIYIYIYIKGNRFESNIHIQVHVKCDGDFVRQDGFYINHQDVNWHQAGLSIKRVCWCYLFIYLTTIKHNYRLHQANISMKKNHSLREQRLKALTCKAMDSRSSCKSYYIQMYRIKKKKKDIDKR